MECNNFRLCITNLEEKGKKSEKCTYSKCLTSYDSRKKVVIEENRKKYELLNPNSDRIANFHIDGGMIPSPNITKCDNLLIDTDSDVAIFIELKGTDLKHALKQIEVMIDKLSNDLMNYRIFARIVTSNRTNVPNIKTCPQYVALNRKVLKNHGNISIHSNIISENISNI